MTKAGIRVRGASATLALVLLGLACPMAAWAAPPTPSAAASLTAPGFTRSKPGVREAYIVSFGLFGGQSVFESEAPGGCHVRQPCRVLLGVVAGRHAPACVLWL